MNAHEYIHSYHAKLAVKRGGEIIPRAEFLDYMTFRANSRPLFTEIFGPLVGVKEEWAAQDATPAEIDLSAFRYRYVAHQHVGINTGWIGGAEVAILEDTPTLLVYRDEMGRRMELSKKSSTLALPVTYPVRNMDDWQKIKHHYAYSPARIRAVQPDPDKVRMFEIRGGFDEPRQLLGEENLALACYEQPELIHDMLQTIGDTAVRLIQQAGDFDELDVHEDMAGRSGPLFGPAQVNEFIVPYYRRCWDAAQERGARLFKQDSDGDMRPIIPAFIAAGVNFMFPCEPAAGMDMVALRRQYGQRMAFMGGIDKHVLRRSQAEIVAELEYKIPPMVKSGGCVLGLDHRIPNGTPLANYRFYVAKAWEIMERCAVH